MTWLAFGKEFEKEFLKAMSGINTNTNNYSYGTTYTNDNKMWVATTVANGGIHMICGKTDANKDFIPVKIIYNPPATICYFPDGTKTVVKCADDEEYCKEEGVMACIIKKIFKSRNQFKKLVEAGYEQPPKASDYHYKKDVWG